MPSVPPPPAPEGRVYGGEGLAERQARRRQQFLDAGLELFGTIGYRATTVRALCKQAKLTDRYFYESFDTMEDLLIALYHSHFQRLQDAVLQAAQAHAQGQASPMEAIRAGLRALFDMAADARVARVCWLEILGVNPRVDEVYNSTFEGFAQLMVSLTKQFYPKVKLPADEERMLGVAVIGAVSQSVQYWMLGHYKESPRTMVAATSRVFEGLIRTLT
jgi:AcrR family transcriptional regulator